jgi:molybdopterin molybdotransferase
MLEVADARRIVLENVVPAAAVSRPLGPDILGLTLAADAISDIDAPPFDKAMMDGFAVHSRDVTPDAVLRIVGEVFAGHVADAPIGPGEAMRIATGAGIPSGADAVVMVELAEVAGNEVRLRDAPIPGKNVQPKATEMRRGDVIVPAGTRLRPEELGLLAAIGQSSVSVYPRPSVAVVSTGDEIVPVSRTPGHGQIRNSNGMMLLAQIARAGGAAHSLGIARDERQSLHEKIEAGLDADFLVLSGGVSAGRADFVPQVLADLGVEALFHKVRLKPGKPVLFGRRKQTLVFGLPGNPVSSLICFELFVRPAIDAWSRRLSGPRVVDAVLGEDVTYKTDRPTYHPAKVTIEAGRLVVRPVAWLGSPDLRGVAAGNGFLIHEPGEHTRRAGAVSKVLLIEDPT